MKIANIKVDYVNHCGDDISTVNAARVSFEKESDWEYYEESGVSTGEVQGLSVADTKLINYLAKHKHKSPFNHSFISVRVKAPIFVARQLVKHKFMPWNEISRRYVDSEPEFFMPDALRAKAANVKQGSVPDATISSLLLYNHTINSLTVYEELKALGACPEQTRLALPHNLMTEWFWSGTLGAFADMLVLRLSSYTQAETRIVAEQVRDIVMPLFPVSLKALLDNP